MGSSKVTKLPYASEFKDLQASINVLFICLLIITAMIIIMVAIRFILSVLNCFDIFRDRTVQKATAKVAAAKKGQTLKRSKRSKSKSKSSVSKSTSKRKSKKRSGKKKREDSKTAKTAGKSFKPKTSESSSSAKRDKPTSSSGGRKWVVEKRGNVSSNSSSIKATSFDFAPQPIGKPKCAHVSLEGVPEPATNTARKYESIATKWVQPPPLSVSGKLYKADECPTPNPFKEPSKNPIVVKSPVATTPPYDSSTTVVSKQEGQKAPDSFSAEKKPQTPLSASVVSSANTPGPVVTYQAPVVTQATTSPNVVTPPPVATPVIKPAPAATPQLLTEHIIYSAGEIPIQFSTENTKTAQEFSSTIKSPEGLASTPMTTADTQNSRSIQSSTVTTPKTT